MLNFGDQMGTGVSMVASRKVISSHIPFHIVHCVNEGGNASIF